MIVQMRDSGAFSQPRRQKHQGVSGFPDL